MLNFQEQAAKDLDAVFFNAPAMEFVEQRKIKGVEGIAAVEHVCNIVVDRERYMEQRISAKSENVTLNGLLFFIKTSEWKEKFKRLPRVTNQLRLDGKLYAVDNVVDDMGMLEITLEIPLGGGPHG